MSTTSLFKIISINTVLIASYLLVFIPAVYAQDKSLSQSLTTPSGEEITFELFKSPNKDIALRILWIAPSFGVDPRHQQTAETLAKQGAEVWLVDLADALFLTKGATSMREIPGQLIADLINTLTNYNDDPAEVLIISNTYGAIPTLRGIHAWQSQKIKSDGFIGTILFSPSLFNHVPELGIEPNFIPELAATNVPIYIFQAANNGNRWHLPAALKKLDQATVYVEILKDVMSVFYEKDRSPNSLKTFENVPKMIWRATKQLRQHNVPHTPIPLPPTKKTSNSSGLNTKLTPYKGIVSPSPVRLRDASGQLFNIKNYLGKVTVINFWASWCPPCVEEIPSLNRLKQTMQGKPFQLISINYAETAEKVREFLNRVNVDFPVLLDPGGQLTGRWKVMAFPSTFVIGPDGNIHYGVNAGIHWDTEEVVQQLKSLLPKSASPKP